MTSDLPVRTKPPTLGIYLQTIERVTCPRQHNVDDEVIRHLDGLYASNQSRHRDDTAVTRRKLGPLPKTIEQCTLRIVLQRRRDRSNVVIVNTEGSA
jgi:hypothetical protein